MRASTSTALLFLNLLVYCNYSSAQNWSSGISFCGCHDCNNAAYNTLAGEHSCGDRILNLIFDAGMTEEAACTQVANREYPTICGPACDPLSCDGRGDDAPPPIPVSAVQNAPSLNLCDCLSCTQQIWNNLAGPYTCGARIEYLQKVKGLAPKAACYEVAALQFPNECGKCNPQSSQCRIQVQAAPEMRPAIEVAPAAAVQAVEAVPVATAVVRPMSNHAAPKTRCGCSRCTENIYSSNANGHACADRMDFLLNSYSHLYPREEDACHQIAHVEFPNQCGPQCDPEVCNGSGNPFNLNSAAEDAPAVEAPINIAAVQAPIGREGLARDMNLYCYPSSASRQTYDNVWGKYTVQVKSDIDGTCGPSDNVFSKQTVSLDNNGRDLKLQFKKVGNKWHAGEVRILLPQAEMPYHYGAYTFSVKSIRVVESQTGSLVSTVLPPSLILGLFTWDPTENYDIHENMNHEVDVEISRWDVPGNADAQFLVQPPGDPQSHRFFSGSDGNSYQQAPHIYGFDWRPAEVEWFSNAGNGGQRFVYSSEKALNAGQIDYNQCMPANVEVRINLWNQYGSTSTPPEMEDTHVVDVVIDNFQFAPSGLTAAPDGNACSKDCHCGPSSTCSQNVCTQNASSVSRNGGTRSRRMASEPHGSGQKPDVSTAPILLLFMVGNLVLAFMVIRRRLTPNELPSSGPNGIHSYEEVLSREETAGVQGA